jgi:antirestriction protein ArdC
MEPTHKSDLPYQIVTDRICALLEQGTAPWHQPWQGDVGMPRNLVSKKPYRGINVFILGSQSYDCPWWLSFKQVQEKGGHIRKGEKMSYVVFWKLLERTTTAEDGSQEPGTLPLLRYYTVVNARQCEGLTLPALEVLEREHTPIEACEALVAGIPNPPTIHHGDSRAYYRPVTDSVHIPDPERFESAERYYATLYHELTHATGHQSRLSRPTLKDAVRFGDVSYAREELVAEMGAAYLCGATGIVNDTIAQSAAYLQGWLKALRNDPRMLVLAAAQAQKAADYLRNVQHDEA